MDTDSLVRLYYDADSTPLVRTDFSDDAAWARVVASATTPVAFGGERYGPGDDGYYEPSITPISERAYDGVTSDALAAAWPTDKLGYVLLADSDSMTPASDPTLLYVDLSDDDGRGDTFRCAAGAVAGVEANLSIANMDFFEFANNVDADGVFRGFGDDEVADSE